MQLEASDIKIDFPVLSKQYLRDLTFGTYQLKQELYMYVNELVRIQGSYEFL